MTARSAKEFLTTGEAAKALELSRSTVSRMFDQGILSGKRHPITGKRLIAAECIKPILERYHLPPDRLAHEKRTLLVCGPEEGLPSLLPKAISNDPRVQIERTAFGADALVLSSRVNPNLLVLEEPLPDIPAAEMIKSLRRSGGGTDLKILCVSSAKDTARLLEAGANECITREALDEARLARKVLGLLGLPEKPLRPARTFEHERRWDRVPINLPATIEVYPLKAPSRRSPGTAVVQNIGIGGAYLTRVQLESGHLPAEPFGLLLKVEKPPLSGWEAQGRVVRLDGDESLGLAVVFVNLSEQNLNRILKVAT